MEATAGMYLLIRLCTCGIWTASGIYEIFNYDHTAGRMAQHHVPASKYLLSLVIVMKLGGSLLVMSNHLVWAAALVWIAFTIPATLLYHSSFRDADGKFVQLQMTQSFKNLSIIGGLLALIALDPDKPQWLLGLLQRI